MVKLQSDKRTTKYKFVQIMCYFKKQNKILKNITKIIHLFSGLTLVLILIFIRNFLNNYFPSGNIFEVILKKYFTRIKWFHGEQVDLTGLKGRTKQ